MDMEISTASLNGKLKPVYHSWKSWLSIKYKLKQAPKARFQALRDFRYLEIGFEDCFAHTFFSQELLISENWGKSRKIWMIWSLLEKWQFTWKNKQSLSDAIEKLVEIMQ